VNSLALSFILFAGASAGALAASVQELRWSELAPLVAGKRVEISLVDGSRVKGEALAVRDDTLVMDIRGSSGPTRFSKGQGRVPQTQVNLIKVERESGALHTPFSGSMAVPRRWLLSSVLLLALRPAVLFR
jgi:hypothetical protein